MHALRRNILAVLSGLLLAAALHGGSQLLLLEKASASTPWESFLEPSWETGNSLATQVFVSGKFLETQDNRQIQKGKRAYWQGQFAVALQLLQQGKRSQCQQQNWLDAARTQSWVALTYQQLGNTEAAQDAIAEAIQLMERSPASDEANRVYARIFNVRGQIQRHAGIPQAALASWQQATVCYQQLGDVWGNLMGQLNQAQALYALQQKPQAADILARVWDSLEEQPDIPLKIQLWYWMGHWWQQTGYLSQGKQALERALVTLRSPQFSASSWQAAGESAILSSLGNLARRQQQFDGASDLYQQAAQIAADNKLPVWQLLAQLNRLRLMEKQEQWEQAKQLAEEIPIPLQDLPATRRSLLAQLERIRLLACLQQRNNHCDGASPTSLQWQERFSTLYQQTQQAIATAENLHDRYALSAAWGTMGWLQEMGAHPKMAMASTEKALRLAETTDSDGLRYQWYWQKGRLLHQMRDRQGAIAAYSEAVGTLQRLRNDKAITYAQIQANFRDRIEPVYRQLVGLLLPAHQQVEPSALRRARHAIEALQLAKMDHFFQDTQLQARSVSSDSEAAIFHTIFLPHRLEVLLSLPDGSLHRHTAWVSQNNAEETLQRLQRYLREPDRTIDVQTLSQQVYGWLLAPFRARLQAAGVNTCVFVLDRTLASIPMSVLYDGERYLLEKYAIARVPGIGMVSPKRQQPSPKALIAGISQERTIGDRYFTALDSVQSEWQTIQSLLPHQLLVNADLTYNNLRKNLQKTTFSILHIATHGEFRTQMQGTFLLLWDQLLTIRELESLLQLRTSDTSQVLDLLVLSACETARGNGQVPLGLAGIALGAGARSTLATLWQVNDESTAALMEEFYRQYITQPQVGKAEALRRAQLSLWQNSQRDWSIPFFWGPYVLVGSWL